MAQGSSEQRSMAARSKMKMSCRQSETATPNRSIERMTKTLRLLFTSHVKR